MSSLFWFRMGIGLISLVAFRSEASPIVIQANQNLSFFGTPGIPSYRDCPGGRACAVAWGKRNDKYLVLDQRVLNGQQYYCVVPIEKVETRQSVESLGANCGHWILNSSTYFRHIPLKDCPKSFQSIFDRAKVIQEIAAQAATDGDLVYEDCRGKKGSYEAELANHDFVNSMDFLPDIDPICTLEAMRVRAKPARYCKGKDIVSNTAKDPFIHCIGPNYHKALHNTLSIVSRCLGLQPQDVLGLLTAESGFNVNTISPTGATGVGQVIDSWVSSFNNTYREHFLKVVDTNPDPVCRKVWPHMVMTHTYPGKKCDAVKPPATPVQSMFVGLAHFVLAEMKLADGLLDYATRVGIRLTDPASKLLLDEIREKEQRLADLKEEAKTLPPTAGWRARQSQLREEINAIETFQLPHLKRKVVMQDGDLRRIMREVAIYSHNWGTGTGPILLNMFLNSRTARLSYGSFKGPNGEFAKFLGRQIPRLSNALLGVPPKSSPKRIADRRSEMLNYVHTLSPGGAGSKSGVSSAVRSIASAVSESTGQPEGAEVRCSSL